ncbi:chromate transporter [Fusobacterium sp. PH5-44]|uniref:chromate transporter n=1 Tax=unclassified Fusobacterium TaxID=2648384 RepID=UPI003D25B7AA
MEKVTEKESEFKKVITIFRIMFKLGCFTFGGGWSIVAQMHSEFVEKRNWITDEQLIDFTSLSRSLPGIMVINISVMFGYSVSGFWGAIAASFGLALPALIAIGIVTYFYTSLRDNIYVDKVLNGIRSAVVPIIISAALKLKAKSLVSKMGYLLMVISFALCTFTKINKIFIVLSGIIIGFVCWKVKKKNAIS